MVLDVQDRTAGPAYEDPDRRPPLAVLVGVVVLAVIGGLVAVRGVLPAAADAAPPPSPGRTVALLSGGGLPVGAPTLQLLQAEGSARSTPGAGLTVGAPALGLQVRDVLPDPDLDLVVVQGGEADAAVGASVESITTSALHLIDRVRAGAGARTAVVLVGPVPATAVPPGSLYAVRDALQAAAEQRSVGFLDPLELGWLAGDRDLGAQLSAAVTPLLPAAAWPPAS